MKSLRILLILAALVLVVPATANAADPLISTNKPALASSNESTARNAAKAFDQNTTTRWSSLTSDPQWIRVDLGSSYRISRVKLNWETAYGKAYRIEVSDDGTNWTQAYSTATGDGGIDDITGLDAVGRYVRMYGTVRGTVWGYSLWEMEVYGAAPLSTNKTATASSQESTTFTPAKAVDQNTATRWSSLDSDPQWLQVDLGATYNVQRVRLNWEQAYATGYRIEVSPNGSTWNQVFSTTTGNGGYDDVSVGGLSATGRYVRMYGTTRANTASGWGYSLYEMEVYGTTGTAPPPVPDTSIQSVVDHDSPTLIDEDGSGDEQVVTSFSGTNSPTGYTCSFTSDSWGGGPVSCTNPWTTSIPVGHVTVSVTACNAGGCDPSPATYRFVMQAAGGNPACDDGIDNDGDGKIDYVQDTQSPADPGCTSLSDTDETDGGGGGSGVDPSGQAMPTGDFATGFGGTWHQAFADNFPTDHALGTFPYGAWDCYPEGWPDTTHNGTYSCPKTVSATDGLMNIHMHTENGVHYVATPMLARNQIYGRYAIRFKTNTSQSYKLAWMIYPEDDDSGYYSEWDYPEEEPLGSSFTAFIHYQTCCARQLIWNSGTDSTGWHTAVIEWSPNRIAAYVDGTKIGETNDTAITQTGANRPFRWNLQSESALSGYMNNADVGDVWIDWATYYTYVP